MCGVCFWVGMAVLVFGLIVAACVLLDDEDDDWEDDNDWEEGH